MTLTIIQMLDKAIDDALRRDYQAIARQIAKKDQPA